MELLDGIVSESINEMYKKYLENVLDIKYCSVFIKRESKLYNSRVCLCDSEGNELTEYMDDIIKLEDGKYYLGVKKYDNSRDNTFYDSEGHVLNRVNDVIISNFCDGIAKVMSLGPKCKCGYVNTKGELLGEIKWGVSSGEFKCGRARVTGAEGDSLGKFGFIDKTGKLIIPCNSIHYSEYSDDVMSCNDGGRVTYFDLNGNELFHDVLSALYFVSGLVRYQDGVKWGFKNKKGEIELKAKYKILGDFCNGIANADGGFIDLTGKKVKVQRMPGGDEYIKGLLKNIYYNSCTGVYDKFDMVPYRDLGDYLLLVDNGKYVIYSKEDGVYTYTDIWHEDKILDIGRVGNIVSINGKNIYLKTGGCVLLSSCIDLSMVMSYEENENVLSYDDFKNKISQDKDAYRELMESNKKEQEKILLEELQNKKREQDVKRQAIIEQLQDLKDALQTLDGTAGNLSKIDEETLFMKVDDHYEIKPEFINQLSFLDLRYLDFKNVKVSGIDFSGSNASINPQDVYQKDMSNGVYDGLIFTSKDFSNVNIRGASFKTCNMDFALLDKAISDDTTKFGDSLKF